MDKSLLKNSVKRRKRAIRVRSKLRGSSERPRLCLIKSNANLNAQIIDDDKGMTLASVATYSKEFRNASDIGRNKNSAKMLGLRLAELAKEKQIQSVIFDRGSSKYHGVVAAFADAAREAGLQF